MVIITDEMRDLIDSALAERVPCLLGTASREGHPQISIKGSMLVYDDQTLAYWERAGRTAKANVAENPNVVVFYRNPERRINWRFHGTAVLHESGPVRDGVMRKVVDAELDRDPDRLGAAVLVRVERIADLAGNIVQDGESP